VAAELLASLDEAPPEDPADVEAAWAREIERRARRVMSGESKGESWEDVRARVMQRLTERHSISSSGVQMIGGSYPQTLDFISLDDARLPAKPPRARVPRRNRPGDRRPSVVEDG
jgi:hypothetical protein